jgi:hypothetical protein
LERTFPASPTTVRVQGGWGGSLAKRTSMFDILIVFTVVIKKKL